MSRAQSNLHVKFLKEEDEKHTLFNSTPASTPLPGQSAFAYKTMTELPGAPKCISMACLDAEYTCVLVDSLSQVPRAVAHLTQEDDAVASPIMADGEFDHILTSRGVSDRGGRRRFASRMALLTLLRGSTAYSFHLPSLFAEDTLQRFSLLDPEEEGTSKLLKLIHTQQVVTWGGTGSDIPALAFAFPTLKLPLKGWMDLQRAVDQGAKSGEFPADVPLSLSKVAMREFGVAMNKSYQLANWGKPPTPLMLAYAATDVIVLQELYKKYKGGTLFAPPQGGSTTD